MVIKKAKSQIATIIVLIIAVIFLFALITMNMSQVAQKKTAVDNVADGVGLQLASQLGSMGNVIKQQNKIYSSNPKKCETNRKLIIGSIGIIIAAVGVSLLSFGVLSGLAAGAAVGFIAGLSLAIAIPGATQQFAASNPKAIDQLQLKLKGFSAQQQIIEMPVQGALFGLADDPAWIRDASDLDKDGDINDLIPRFFKWYNLRLDSFRKPDASGNLEVGNAVKTFYNGFFKDGINDRFYFDTNDVWMVKSEEEMKREGKELEDAVRWWVDSNQDGIRNAQDVKIVPWLRNELIPMLGVMRQYGYGIKVSVQTKPGKPDEIDVIRINDNGSYFFEEKFQSTDETYIADAYFFQEVEDFENIMVRDLYNLDFDSAVSGVDMWLPLLKNPNNEDWDTRLGKMLEWAKELRDTLEQRRIKIDECVEGCGKSREGCCSSRGDGAECDWVCVSCC